MKISIEDVKQAEKVVRPYIHHTLLERSGSSSQVAGFDVSLKFENLQQTGSFKIRGAANKISRLSDKEKQTGVIAASAGNHAQGVACVAQKLGVKAVIVMPELSPLIKVVSTRRFGAEVVLKGATYDDAYQHALELQKQHGYVFVHPYEDELIIAGQGTCGLEIVHDCPDVDTVFVAIGGGGLISGIATVVKAHNPNARIIGVQAAGADAMARSFKEHKLAASLENISTIADGIAVKRPSARMYEDFISKLCDDVVTVTDDEIAKAIVFLMERAKSVVEGAGAAPLAAAFSYGARLGTAAPDSSKLAKPKRAVVVLGGGNIDLNMIERIIDRGLQAAGRIAKIQVAAPDVPGTLNRLTALVAEKRANILNIMHSRVSDKIALRETLIEFTLETTGHDQIEQIRRGFEKLGSKIID